MESRNPEGTLTDHYPYKLPQLKILSQVPLYLTPSFLNSSAFPLLINDPAKKCGVEFQANAFSRLVQATNDLHRTKHRTEFANTGSIAWLHDQISAPTSYLLLPLMMNATFCNFATRSEEKGSNATIYPAAALLSAS